MIRSRRDDNYLHRLSRPPKLPGSGGTVRLRAGEDLPATFGASVKKSGQPIQMWVESYNAIKAAAWKLLPFLVNPFHGYIRVPGIWIPDLQLWDLCASGEIRCDGKVFIYWVEGDVVHAVCLKHQVTVDVTVDVVDTRMICREAWYLFKVKTLMRLLEPAPERDRRG